MRHLGLIGFVILIILLATIWRLPPYFQDAVSETPAAGYEVFISPARIVFEPILGPLLFFMRAHKPAATWFSLIGYGLIAGLILNLRHHWRKSSGGVAGVLWRSLRSSLSWLPVITAILVTVMLLMLFVPLPCNNIINHNPETILINFHSHSYFSYDGFVSPLRLIKWHQRNNFDAFFLTEHNLHQHTLELVEEQQKGNLPAEPLLLPGEEFSGSHHILLLGLNRDFNTKGLTDEAAIDSCKKQDGAALVAHWFQVKRRTRPIAEYIDAGVDGFEIANYARGIYYKKEYIDAIRQNCQRQGLLMVGDVDYHGYGAANFVWNALTIPGWRTFDREKKISSIMQILHQRDQSRVQVLLYRDRQPIPKSLQVFAPILTLIFYFRSLNHWQLLSWLIWIVIFNRIYRWCRMGSWRAWIPHSPGAISAVIGSGCGVITLMFGIWLLSQYPVIAPTNRIYIPAGWWLFGLGLLFFVYGLMLLRKIKKLELF